MIKWICSIFGFGNDNNDLVGLYQLKEPANTTVVIEQPKKNKELKLSDLMKGN